MLTGIVTRFDVVDTYPARTDWMPQVICHREEASSQQKASKKLLIAFYSQSFVKQLFGVQLLLEDLRFCCIHLIDSSPHRKSPPTITH